MKDKIRILALILLIFNGISGLAGGYGLISDPSGSAVGLSTDLLVNSPFTDFLVPGLVLLAANGILSLIAVVLVLRRHSLSAAAVGFEGFVLCGWMLGEIIMLGVIHPLQYIFGFIALLLIVCGFLMGAHNSPVTPRRPKVVRGF